MYNAGCYQVSLLPISIMATMANKLIQAMLSCPQSLLQPGDHDLVPAQKKQTPFNTVTPSPRHAHRVQAFPQCHG